MIMLLLPCAAAADNGSFTVTLDFNNGHTIEKVYSMSDETYGTLPAGYGCATDPESENFKGAYIVAWMYYDGNNWVIVSENTPLEREDHTLKAVWNDNRTAVSKTAVSSNSVDINESSTDDEQLTRGYDAPVKQTTTSSIFQLLSNVFFIPSAVILVVLTVIIFKV